MDYNQIRYIMAVAECKNFSRAAELLYVTQPTLSQQISKLEKELKINLFERNTRAVYLTKEGEKVIEKASKVASAWDEMIATSQTLSELSRHKLIVGLLPTLGRRNMVQCIQQFAEGKPEIQLEIVSGYSDALTNKLLAGKLDMVIINTYEYEDSLNDKLEIHPLVDNPIVVVMSTNHPLSIKMHIQLQDMQNAPFIALRKESTIRKCMDMIMAKNNIIPNTIVECDIESLSDLVSANLGISFLTMNVAKNQSDIIFRPVYPQIMTHTSVVMEKDKVQKPFVRELINHLENAFLE